MKRLAFGEEGMKGMGGWKIFVRRFISYGIC